MNIKHVLLAVSALCMAVASLQAHTITGSPGILPNPKSINSTNVGGYITYFYSCHATADVGGIWNETGYLDPLWFDSNLDILTYEEWVEYTSWGLQIDQGYKVLRNRGQHLGRHWENPIQEIDPPNCWSDWPSNPFFQSSTNDPASPFYMDPWEKAPGGICYSRTDNKVASIVSEQTINLSGNGVSGTEYIKVMEVNAAEFWDGPYYFGTALGVTDVGFGRSLDWDVTMTYSGTPPVFSQPSTPSVSLTSTTDATGKLWNIDFGDIVGNQKVGFAATGNSASDVWNWQTSQRWTSPFTLGNLKTADGNTTPVSVTVNNAPGDWGSSVNDPMFANYIYPWYGGNITATINGLPPGAYSFYLYGHGAADNQNSVFRVTSGSGTAGPAATDATSQWSNPTPPWISAQYVVLGGTVTVANPTVTVTVSPGVSGYAILNGMQIKRTF